MHAVIVYIENLEFQMSIINVIEVLYTLALRNHQGLQSC